MPFIVPQNHTKTHGENCFRSLLEGDSPRCGEMSAKQTKGTAPSALSSNSETEGVGVLFTPSVKTCGFATSLYEGGECGGQVLLACLLRQHFCSFYSQRCPPDTRAPP